MKRVAVRWSWPADGSSRISVCGLERRGRSRAPAASAGRTRASAAAARGCSPRRSARRARGRRRRARRSPASSNPGSAGPKSELLADRPGEQHLAGALEDVAEDGRELTRRCARPSARHRRRRPRRSVRMRPIAIRKSVVLPEPFGPRTATISRAAERRVDAVEDLAIAVAGDGRRGTRGAAAPARSVGRRARSVRRAAARFGRRIRAAGVRSRRACARTDLERQLDARRVGDREEARRRSPR